MIKIESDTLTEAAEQLGTLLGRATNLENQKLQDIYKAKFNQMYNLMIWSGNIETANRLEAIFDRTTQETIDRGED